MAFGTGGKDGGLKAEINVTPLVDVVLVLLIIFMVITPMLTRGRNVQLPVAASADAESEAREAIVLTVSADKKVWLDTNPVDDATLISELKRRTALHPDQEVLIKVDSTVTVKDLRPLLQKLKKQNITQIAFAVLGQKGAAK